MHFILFIALAIVALVAADHMLRPRSNRPLI